VLNRRAVSAASKATKLSRRCPRFPKSINNKQNNIGLFRLLIRLSAKPMSA
jgi:hypothetical protein